MADAAAAPVAAERVAGSAQAMLVVDDDCVCTHASLGACRLLGAARSELVGSSFGSLLEYDSRERFDLVWRAFRSAGGHAEPFRLVTSTAPGTVALTVKPDLVPGRHLVRLDRASGANGSSLFPSAGRGPTSRECEILDLLAEGATDARIAALLDLSPATVQTHVRNAKAKLGAATRTQAVALAIRQGLIQID